MIDWIRSWSLKLEFSIITAIAFIAPVIGSTLILINQSYSSFFSDQRLLRTILLETAILLAICYIFYLRGIDRRRLALNPSWGLTGQGLLLYLVAALASGLTIKGVTALYPAADMYLSSLRHGNHNINIVAIVALSIINPLYEELLLVGFVITAMEKLTTSTKAVLVSVSIRAVCHFYQGPAGIAGVLVMGIIFAYIFVKKRQLWPLIVAHGIWDFLGFLALARS